MKSSKAQPNTKPRSHQPETPTKRVTLKLKVKDEDLAQGKFRSPGKQVKTTRRKTTPGPRAKRGKSKKSDVKALVNSDLFGPDEDEEREEQEERERERERERRRRRRQSEAPSLPDFRVPSLLSFPVLTSSDSPLDRLSAQTQLRLQPQERDLEPYKRCAGCGVLAKSVARPITDFPAVAADQDSPHVVPGAKSTANLIITRDGSYPNTANFWYDKAVAELAKKSSDLDFKMLCLNLIRWKAQNDDSEVVCGYRQWLGGCYGDRELELGAWDRVIRDIVFEARARGEERRGRMREGAKAARWAVWECGMRCRSRGRFADDPEGAWVVREPGLDGAVRKVLKLGYKRVGRPDTGEGNQARDVWSA